jgi:hypothetical protein
MKNKFEKRGLGIAMAVGVCVLIVGCTVFNKPVDSAFASVEIEHHSKQEIEAATIAVFKQAGYRSVGGQNELEFESDGKEWMQAAYGSNIASGDPIMERVRAQVVYQSSGVFRLQCNAYVVQNAGKEIKLRIHKSGPYRELLDQVTRKLSQTPR